MHRSLMNRSSLSIISAVVGLVSARVARCDVQIANELGISAESLAVAGLTGAQVSGLMSQFELDLETGDAWKNARSNLAQAVAAVTILADSLATEPTESLVTDYVAALDELKNARDAHGQVSQEIFALMTDGMSSAQINTLVACSLSADRLVPLEFRATTRTPEQWAAIETALIAEARAIRTGTTLATEHDALLDSVRAESAVVQAQSSITSNLAAIQAVLDTE